MIAPDDGDDTAGQPVPCASPCRNIRGSDELRPIGLWSVRSSTFELVRDVRSAGVSLMLRASVLLPTHVHAATLPFAVASVQAQGIDDIEILIVGDGVNDTLR